MSWDKIIGRREPVADPLWGTCHNLVTPAEYQEQTDGGRFTHRRAVTWAQHPYRYMLAEYAEKATIGMVRRRNEIEPLIYELGKLSAERLSTGEHEYDRFYVVKSGLIAALHQSAPRPERMSESDKESFRATVDFTIGNGLFAPNAEDQVEIEASLKLGEMDGVEPYYFS